MGRLNSGVRWGAAMLLFVLFVSLAAPLFSPHDPNVQNPERMLEPPSREHWCGTDQFGRDIFSRLLHGGRISLGVAAATVLAILGVGLTTGIAAGYFGGWLDMVIMRVVDVLLAFPAMVLALVTAGLFDPGLDKMLLAMSGVWWVYYTRLIRGIALQARQKTTVEAARALGASSFTIIRVELLPELAGPVVVLATIDMGYVILVAAGLSFLGLGAQPPSPEWGAMLAEGRVQFFNTPHVVVFPGLAIFITVLAFNLLGEGLRDMLDPTGTTLRGEAR